jgi:4-alpha-glucanotransferase
MRHAAALRIDHIMSLMRLYWIPEGAKPDAGGYVAYPLDELLAVLALESRRNRCMIVGEALGTVPAGFAERLEDRGILAYRLLYFARNQVGEFLPADRYPRASLVAVATHDLATLTGFWRARDLEHRRRLGLFTSPQEAEEAFQARDRDRRLLLEALERENVLDPAAGVRAAASRDATAELIEAAYWFLGRSPARLLMVAIEDALGLIEQANLPGTVDEHPNWQRRLPVPVEELHRQGLLRRIAARLRHLRP